MSHLWAEFVNFVTLYLQNTLSTMTSSQLPAHFVITIGRSFGAGGRALGQILAKRLGFAYYDKELLNEAAARAGLDLSIFEKNDERAPGFLSGLLPMSMGYNALAWYTGPNSVSGESVYGAQSDFIREIAAKGPCVIVGRTAEYVLRDFPGAVNIFLHAPEDECVKRIMARHDCKKESEARSILRKTNKLRSEFYNFYTDRTWGDAATYDITFDSSRLGLEAIADIVVAYMEARKKQMAQ